jgi:hypothetical protein
MFCRSLRFIEMFMCPQFQPYDQVCFLMCFIRQFLYFGDAYMGSNNTGLLSPSSKIIKTCALFPQKSIHEKLDAEMQSESDLHGSYIYYII